MPSMTINKRYILLDMLGQGGMGAVYRAQDRLSGQTVALKRITFPADKSQGTPGSDFQVAISNEFRVLASLRHPYIIKVLDYGIETGQPYFTMELLDAPQTILAASQGAPLATKIRLLVELLQALVYLHRHGILHRDLKPANVLVDQSGTVKALDFGLSLMTSHSLSNIQQNTAGTLAYMAPELFSEEPASVSSDLYAIGVIACEMLAGHHPFNQKNVAALMYGVLTLPPDLSGMDAVFMPVLRRLLEKEPAKRFTGAEEVIHALCEASGQPFPAETSAIRESFLQAARFVGRTEELGSLRAALKQVIGTRSQTQTEVPEKRGSAWLVGGESGSGKSRLCEELQIRSMVSGALVVHGQAITQGSLPYHPWREPLRRLVIAVDLNDEEAAILKTLVPDIDLLLDRPIPQPPALDPLTSQAWLMKVISDVFRRLGQPVVVILEDLQWAAQENLTLLNRLMLLTGEMPLLLVSNYRNDETPHLPDALPGVQLITLNRFDDSSIAALSEAMLGKAGQQPEIISYLHHETEGNVFFLVEVVRALAEQTGQLDRISEAKLDIRLMPKGVQDIVQRRLSRVPMEIRPLLQVAALAGRDLDLKLLASFETHYSALNGDLDKQLAACVDATVLEIQEQRWRFAHDRLREALIAEIPAETLPTLHLQLGEALERLYPNSPSQIPAMAHHFQQASAHAKAIHYLNRAGQIASAANANDRAIDYFRSAINTFAKLDASDQQTAAWRDLFRELHEQLGDLLELTGSHAAAREAYQVASDHLAPENVIGQARLVRKIGKAWENQRAYPEALQCSTSAIDSLDRVPANAQTEWWSEWIQSQMNCLMVYYWTNKPQEMKEQGEKVREAFEVHGTPVQQRAFFLTMALMTLRRDRYTPSAETLAYLEAALKATTEWNDTSEDSYNHFLVGFIHLWCSELDKAELIFRAINSALERIGEVTTLSRSLAYLAFVYRKRGQIDEVRRYAQRTIEISEQGQMFEYIASAKGHLSWIALREGNITQAKVLAEEGYQVLPPSPVKNAFIGIICWPLVAAETLSGQLDQAIPHVRLLLGPTQQLPPESVQFALRSAVQAWEQNNTEAAQQYLMVALDLMRPSGYV